MKPLAAPAACSVCAARGRFVRVVVFLDRELVHVRVGDRFDHAPAPYSFAPPGQVVPPWWWSHLTRVIASKKGD